MTPFTRLTIAAVLLDRVVEHARAEAPNECCGLVAGFLEAGNGIATECIPIGNDLASPTAFVTNAQDLFAAFRHLRDSKLELLAVYHSHPSSEPVPSRHDVTENTYGETAAHLIIGLAGREATVRAWWLFEGGFREAELAIAPKGG